MDSLVHVLGDSDHQFNNNPFIKTVMYEIKSISKLQIQVATYVFELSAGNCQCQLAALSSFTATCNDRYAHDCKDGTTVIRWRRP